jgi:hypothetical protein
LESHLPPSLSHVPFHAIGQHGQKNVRLDPSFETMMNRSCFKILSP